MRTSARWLAAAVLGLGAASGAHAQGIQFNPFQTKGTPIQYSPFQTSTQIAQPFSSGSTATPPSGASQATFPAPGRLLGGPSRLINLLPNLHPFSNTHTIGSSVFPTQTDQYLAQFGYQRLR